MSKFVVNILEYGPDKTGKISQTFKFDNVEEALTFTSEYNAVGFANKTALAPMEGKD